MRTARSTGEAEESNRRRRRGKSEAVQFDIIAANLLLRQCGTVQELIRFSAMSTKTRRLNIKSKFVVKPSKLLQPSRKIRSHIFANQPKLGPKS